MAKTTVTKHGSCYFDKHAIPDTIFCPECGATYEGKTRSYRDTEYHTLYEAEVEKVNIRCECGCEFTISRILKRKWDLHDAMTVLAVVACVLLIALAIFLGINLHFIWAGACLVLLCIIAVMAGFAEL